MITMYGMLPVYPKILIVNEYWLTNDKTNINPNNQLFAQASMEHAVELHMYADLYRHTYISLRQRYSHENNAL